MLDDLEGYGLYVLLHRWIIKLSSNQSLDRKQSVLRINYGL